MKTLIKSLLAVAILGGTLTAITPTALAGKSPCNHCKPSCQCSPCTCK